MGASAGNGMSVKRFAEGGSAGLGSGTPQTGGMFKGLNLGAAHNSLNSYLSQSNPSATQAAIASAMANMYGPPQLTPGSIPQPNRRGDSLPTSPVFQPISQDPNVMTDQRTGRIPYQPRYIDYATGLDATPEARRFVSNYKPQIPTPDRPGSTGGSRLDRPVSSGMPKQTQKADPNLAILNQVLGPQPKYAYDSDGNSHPAPPQYMDASQRDALLKNPSAYLDYAKHIKSGGDPAKFVPSKPVNMYMTQAQKEAFRKKQIAELSKLLPPAYVEDYGGS